MAHDYAKKPRSNPSSGARSKPRAPARRMTAPRRHAPPPKAGVPGWMWLVVGVAVGAFVMFLVRLADVDPAPKKTKPAIVAEKPKPAKVAAKPSTAKPSTVKPSTTQKVIPPAELKPAIAEEKPEPIAKVEPTAEVKNTQQLQAEPEPEPEKPRFDFYQMLKENEVPVALETSNGGQPLEPIKERIFILQVASFRKVEDAEQLKVELILLNMTSARVETVTVRNGEQWSRVLVGPFTDRSALAKARSTLIARGNQALVMEYKDPKTTAN